MNRLIFGADDYLKKWAAKQIGIDGFGPSVSIGVQRDGEIIAAAVYHDLRQGQIEASIAAIFSRRWASRSVLHALFAYPFNQVGVNRLLVQCSEANEESHEDEPPAWLYARGQAAPAICAARCSLVGNVERRMSMDKGKV